MKIWISYSFADKEFVSVLKTQLQNVQLEVIDYESAVMPGDNIEDSIYRSISEADVLLVVLSRDSVNSHSLFAEMGMIISEIKNNYRKKFIPILLDEQISIPLFVKSYKYLDLTDNNSTEQIEKLIEMLKLLNQKEILLKKEKEEYKKKDKQRQFSLYITLIGSIMAVFATIFTFMFASGDFFSFNINKNILLTIVSTTVAVFVGVFVSLILGLLKKK